MPTAHISLFTQKLLQLIHAFTGKQQTQFHAVKERHDYKYRHCIRAEVSFYSIARDHVDQSAQPTIGDCRRGHRSLVQVINVNNATPTTLLR